MILYHGSNVKVDNPKIINSFRRLDFGIGFYLTSDYEQAKRWAEITTERKGYGKPIVSVFEYNDSYNLNIKKFNEPTAEWLKFVSKNRNFENVDDNYDIIIGPVADDNTMPVITRYLTGIYDEEETLKRLLPQKLKNQYVFKNELALQSLKFEGVLESEK